MVDSGTITGAISLAGFVPITADNARQRLELLERQVKSLPDLRRTLCEFERKLKRVQRVYGKALLLMRAEEDTVRELTHAIEECQQPCDAINEMLLEVL